VLSVGQLLLGIVFTIDVDDLSQAALTRTLLLLASALVVLAFVLQLIVFSFVLIFCLCDVFLLLLGLGSKFSLLGGNWFSAAQSVGWLRADTGAA
jgi:hypothetical protein